MKKSYVVFAPNDITTFSEKEAWKTAKQAAQEQGRTMLVFELVGGYGLDTLEPVKLKVEAG